MLASIRVFAPHCVVHTVYISVTLQFLFSCLADLEEVGHKTLKHMFTVHSATENDDFVLLA